MIWKNNELAGVGIARGYGENQGDVESRSVVAGKIYVVVSLDPGQSAEAEIRENVLPAAGQ